MLAVSILKWVARLSLVLFLCADFAHAQNNSGNFSFILGSGFLCDASDFSLCPAVAKTIQGDSYEISGAGTFDTQNKSVKAAGTFSHKSVDGNVVETGVWTASELVSFVSYGIAPGALLHEKTGSNPMQFAPMRVKASLGPIPTGGLAVFRVRLLMLSGVSKTGILQVNCALGEVPRERSVEGMRLSLENGGSEFSEEVGGRVMFLSMRAQARSSTKTPPDKGESDSVQTRTP